MSRQTSSPLRAQVAAMIAKGPDAPTASPIVVKVMELARDERAHATHLSDLISRDVALTTKMLKLVNSAFYRLGREVTSIQHAVVVLGARVIRNLALSFTLLGTFPLRRDRDFDFQLFWEHSLRRAVLARLIAIEIRSSNADEAMTVGLMLDIGALVLRQYFPAEYGALPILALDPQEQCRQERELLGDDHAAVGGALCRKWQLPRIFSQVLGTHHDVTPANLQKDEEQIWRLVTIADALADLYRLGATEKRLTRIVNRAKSEFGMEAQNLEMLLNRSNAEVAAAARLFELGFLPEAKEISLTAPPPAEPAPEAKPVHAAPAPVAPAPERPMAPPVAQFSVSPVAHANPPPMVASSPGPAFAAVPAMLRAVPRQASAPPVGTLSESALRDPATGLFQAAFLNAVLRLEVKRAQRHRRSFLLLLIRIDALEAIYQAAGPEIGEQILSCMARRVRLRGSDVVARVSEDTLCALCMEAKPTDATNIAERLRRAISDSPLQIDGQAVRITVSLGAVAYDSKGDLQDDGALLDAAQEALFRARAEGGNRSAFWP